MLTNLGIYQNALYQIRLAVCKMPALTTERGSNDFTVALPDGIISLNDDRWQEDVATLLQGYPIYTRGKRFKLA